MTVKISDNVTWVGKIDWDLRHFHGKEYSTHKGTSYNSYLIRDDKTVLIDTVWKPYADEFVSKLKQEIDLNEIDYIVINHGEIDHSGALPELMREIPNTPIYTTKNGVKSLRGHYHQDWNFVEVKSGDQLDLGRQTLTFVEAKMLHWPDTMFCYLDQDGILFSNDAFGQHYASEHLFNDLVDQGELYHEALKYYANILTPFNKMVERKIEELQGMNLTINTICTSHGVIWRDNPLQIVEKYLEWSRAYQENQISIVYDTMWEGTRRVAESIAEGIKETSPETTIKLFNSAKTDKNDLIAELFKSKGIIMGSPTINRGILHSTAGLMEMIKGFKFQNKSAAAFGCYGWSGESPGMIEEELTQAGLNVIEPALKIEWHPNEEDSETAYNFGSNFASQFS